MESDIVRNNVSNNKKVNNSSSNTKHKAERRKLSSQDHHVLWATSRLFSNQKKLTGIKNRCLLVSIKVSNMERDDSIKLQIYKKFIKTLNEMFIDTQNEDISMLVSGDVEGSRNFNVDRSTMLCPYEPHYHAILVFSDLLWENLHYRLEEVMIQYACNLADIAETKLRRTDIKSERFKRYLWWKIYDDQILKGIGRLKYKFPLGRIVSYSTKADLIANRLHTTQCQPSVFPYDLLLDKKLINRSDSIFGQLMKRQLGETK